MSAYEKCPAEVRDLCIMVIGSNHPHLRDAGVKVDCLFKYAKRDKHNIPLGPALKLHGYTCAAVVRVNPLKKRAMGLGDAEITIDGDEWPDWSERQREALLDHELTHLITVEDKKIGGFKRDDLNRPVLHTRLHDWQLGGFKSVVERYGSDSFDLANIESFQDEHGQYLFGFSDAERRKKTVAG